MRIDKGATSESPFTKMNISKYLVALRLKVEPRP